MTCPKFCWPRGAQQRNWIIRVYLGTLNWLGHLPPIVERRRLFQDEPRRSMEIERTVVIWLIRPNRIRIRPTASVLRVNVKGFQYSAISMEFLFCSFAKWIRLIPSNVERRYRFITDMPCTNSVNKAKIPKCTRLKFSFFFCDHVKP